MGLDIIFRESQETTFLRYWEEMVRAGGAGSRYSPLSLEANLLLARYRGVLVGDKSFVCLKNRQPVAGVLLPIERWEEHLVVSSAHGYVDAPLVVAHEVEDEVFGMIDRVAREHHVAKIMFSVDALREISACRYNYLQRYHYLDTSILSYVIDLRIEDLFSALRRNHQRSIKRILQDSDFSVIVIDSVAPSYERHEEFRMLHEKCAGRVTAPKEAFDVQFEKLKRGQAVLLGLRYREVNIAYMYFDHHGDTAVSYQAADDPDYDRLPLYHVLTFAAMEYLQKKGVCAIDTGQPSGPSHQMDYYPDRKQRNIGLFKRGFGGDFVAQHRGAKYWSRDLWESDMRRFAGSYVWEHVD